MSAEIEPNQFVDFRRFHTDKFLNGANMFNGIVQVQLNPKVDEMDLGFGCGVYSAYNAADLLGRRPDQQRSLHTGYELGFDENGFPYNNYGRLFSRHDLSASHSANITNNDLYNLVNAGGIAMAMIWEPDWYHYNTSDDQGHTVLIAGLEDPNRRGNAAQALIIDPSHPQADGLTYHTWTISLRDLDTIWWDANYPFTVSGCGGFGKSPKWLHRNGYLIASNNSKG